MKKLIIIFLVVIASFALEIREITPTVAIKGEKTKITIKGEGFNENTKVSTSGYIAKNEVIGNLNFSTLAKLIEIKDNYAYLIMEGGEFNIIDISEPNNPILKLNMSIEMDEKHIFNSITLQESLLFITSLSFSEVASKLTIIDISKPLKPIIKFNQKFDYFINEIVIKDNLAFIAKGARGVDIFDISNRSEPIFKSNLSKLEAYSIKIRDNLIFLAGEGLFDGLNIIDISNLKEPILKSNIVIDELSTIKKILLQDEFIYLIDMWGVMAIVNISNINEPLLESTLKVTSSININSMEFRDNLLYISTGDNVITLVDVANPKEPILKSSSSVEVDDVKNFIYSLKIRDNLMYISTLNGFIISTISNISTSTIKSAIRDFYIVDGVKVEDDLIYISADGMLYSYELNNLTTPISTTLITDTTPSSLLPSPQMELIQDNLAFIVNYDRGLIVVDISNPNEPTIIDNLTLIGEGNIQSIALSDNSLFSVNGFDGLFEIEIPTLLETTFIDSNTLKVTFPNYTTLGKYNLRVTNDNENFSKAYGVVTLEEKKILDSIIKKKSLELKVIGEAKESYEVGESIELLALYKNEDGSFENMFVKLKSDEYKIEASDESKVSILGNRITFLASGEVAIKMQAKTQEAILKFKVKTKDGTFEKEINPIDMIIVVGKDNEVKKLEKAFIKNGNDLYLFALGLTNPSNINYLNSISKEQILVDIDENFGKDNVILEKVVNFENIKKAIENTPYSTSPLIIHIIGHGSAELGGKIMLEEEYLPAVGLKKVLDDYQASTNRDVIIVVDACYSGAFAKSLQNKDFKRLIITSVNENETAIMAPLDGTSYSKYLKEYFGLGNSMGVSFDEASQIYRNLSNSSLSPTIKGDEILQNFQVPNPKITSGLSEVFLNYNSSENIGLNESKKLFVEIKLSEFEKKTLVENAVYAKVIPPQTIDLNVGEFEIPTIEIEKVILKEINSSSESVTYKANYSFNKKGIYKIAFAIENNLANTIETKPIEIKVEDEAKATLFLAIDENQNENDNFFLSEWWNLVASPIKEGIDVKELEDIKAIWSYDGSWKSDISRLEPNRGYWIKSKSNQSYKFSGAKYKIDFNNLNSGWNLLGTGERVYKYEFENIEDSFLYENSWLKGNSEYFHYLESAKGVWVKK